MGAGALASHDLVCCRLGLAYPFRPNAFKQVGTMFPTGSHPEKLEVEGPALMADVDAALRQACLRERVHLCGVGGITPLNCGNVLRAGADSVAVISGITSIGGSVARTVQAFRDTFARMEEEERRALSNDT